jgi:hypothetical protein
VTRRHWSGSRLVGSVLPERFCDKIEESGAGRTGGPDKPISDGIGAKAPGPANRDVSRFAVDTGQIGNTRFATGFRAAGARFVEPLARCPASRFAPLLPDRLAARKTELLPTRREPL